MFLSIFIFELKMKHFCRICLKAITNLNFVAIKMDDETSSQIRLQLSICVPEMVLDVVKDPIICEFCVCALRSAYSFKNLCLSTEQHIRNYSRKVSSIAIEDLLYDLEQSTRTSACANNGECKNTTKTNIYQRPVTLPVDTLNKINDVNNVTAKDFCNPVTEVTADDLNSLLDDAPTLLQVFKQEGENENEDITVKEEDVALQEVESSYEGFEDNLFEDDKSEDPRAEVKSIDGESPMLQTNIEAQSCFVKLTRLSKDNVHKHSKFVCKICKFTTRSKYYLKKHELFHKEKNYLSCASCNFQTVHKSSLLQHMRTHTGEKPFACNVCTYSCTTSSNLQNHLRTHTGEKPFVCTLCTYRCSQKASLQNHLRTHTGEKPFACTVCTFRCTQKSGLQSHLRTHTGEKPFACNVCNLRFTWKSQLQQHVQIHTGEKPFDLL